MSYQDPYYQPTHYPQPYTDAPDFDPYNARQRHPTYDQSGYRDGDDDGAGAASRTHVEHDQGTGVKEKEKSKYEDMFPPVFRPPGDTGAIRIWRKEHQGPLWAKGSRGACFLRFCCCTFFIAIFLIISIILTLAIWIRPPDITVNQVGLSSADGSTFEVTADSLNLNLAVNISVDNPNYFSVAFKDIKLNLTYPLDSLPVGGGEKDNVVFHANTETTFNFPFKLTYTLDEDPNQAVLKDLLTKCGILGGTKQNLNIDYKITLGLKILFVTVSPSISNNFNFACPVNANDLADLLKGSGINVGQIISASGGGS